LTATKWWIGGAAHSATHSYVQINDIYFTGKTHPHTHNFSAVFARLIVDGKDYGVKPFIVPLRNPQDYTLLPGISIGDIGMKMGRNGIDNGWIQFTNVRIPRTFMLMKHTKVTRSVCMRFPPDLLSVNLFQNREL
jgi:acyl-CoA oxidase